MNKENERAPGWFGYRRWFLGGAVASLLTLAGCQGDFPSSRQLEIRGINKSSTESGWRFTITVTADILGKYLNGGKPAFRDVTLVGYDETSDRICETHIGDIPDTEQLYKTEVTMVCEQIPTYLTFTTADGPCGADAVIQLLTYGPDEDQLQWRQDERTCGGGPPFGGTTEGKESG